MQDEGVLNEVKVKTFVLMTVMAYVITKRKQVCRLLQLVEFMYTHHNGNFKH
jgi:hypothetical protein